MLRLSLGVISKEGDDVGVAAAVVAVVVVDVAASASVWVAVMEGDHKSA
jgi:hypothetical protein